MTWLISIVSFFIVILVLILAHEIGHFITARATGVRVEEFGLGFPPRLLSIKRGETLYSLNAIPLGGFVKMAGEEDPEVLGSLAGKSTITRILVLGAGSLMNFLLPLLLFAIAFMIPFNLVVGQVIAEEVAPGSPAARAGIRPGDTILSVNDKPVDNNGDLQRYIQLNLGKEVNILVRHSDLTTEKVQVTPRWRPPAGQGAIGIVMSISNATISRQHYPFWRAIPLGVSACVETFVLFKNGLVSMMIGAAPVAVAGPVGIAQLTGEVAKAGISPLLEFAAFLSINLAIINLFPLPALDGGRIAFVLLEWMRRGKRLAPKAEGLVHLIGLVMIMAFILAITYRDIVRIINGESLMP
ncbi:MAG: site-2 protease family protein [Chloroflexi bacterium]|nr:site-2 protease family protein [Chloroflexota bacterium]MBI3930578.1 site-2 protease family protein [Chloroflexota bacterium]